MGIWLFLAATKAGSKSPTSRRSEDADNAEVL